MHVHTSKEFLNAMTVTYRIPACSRDPKMAAARQYPLVSANNYHALKTGFDKINASRLRVLCMQRKENM
jgi:hypothetical protein